MHRLTTWFACLVLPAGLLFGSGSDDDPIGRKVQNFSLRDYRGKSFDLGELSGRPVVIVAFVGTECPLANLYSPRLRELAETLAPRGVAFVGINSNMQDSVTDIAHWVKEHHIDFPVLKDVGNRVADQFSAQRTPEVYVLDRDRVVRYHGRIDDQYGVGTHRPRPMATYLADAIESVLADNPVATPVTESVGCLIGRTRSPSAASAVTYSRDIAPILQNRCVVCHREGEIAPFALTKYEEVAGWAEMIHEVVGEGRMPPWHASDRVGRFANDPRLSRDEKDLIRRWVRAGAPEGDPKDLPAPRQFTSGWRIPTPDLVLPIQERPFAVQATGQIVYQHFVVDPGFKEDRWIRAAECRPGSRSVVHHIIAFIIPPESGPRTGHSTIGSMWLVATAPGAVPLDLPDGLAKFVPAGSKFIFQVHYQPNGTPQEDLSHLGLVFANAETVRKEVGVWRAADAEFVIPPGAPDHEVTATHTIRQDTLLLTMFPHMHLRGKSFRYEAEYPDGQREVLLDVPRYDFGWQNSYELASPRRLPAGTKLICTAHFDNSPANPNNPDPSLSVRWGDQTTDEMMAGHFEVVLADQDLTKNTASTRRTDQFLSHTTVSSPSCVEELLSKIAETLSDKGRDDNLPAFGRLLREHVPQVDRVDVTVAGDKDLEFQLEVPLAVISGEVPGRGAKLSGTNLALLAYARGTKPVRHDVLDNETPLDLKLMGRAFGSSLHVPVKWNGQPGTVNFWSEELVAFPGEAVAILRRVAELLAKSL